MSNEFEQRLSEYGIPTDAVKGMIREELQSREQANTADAELIAKVQADPWLNENLGRVIEFTAQNPQIAEHTRRIAESDKEAAIHYAAELYRASGGGRAPMSAPGRAPSALNGTEHPIGHTFLMPGTEPTQQPQQAPPAVSHPVYGQPDAVQQARERYQRTGSRQDAVGYAKARLKTVISEDWLRQ